MNDFTDIILIYIVIQQYTTACTLQERENVCNKVFYNRTYIIIVISFIHDYIFMYKTNNHRVSGLLLIIKLVNKYKYLKSIKAVNFFNVIRVSQ